MFRYYVMPISFESLVEKNNHVIRINVSNNLHRSFENERNNDMLVNV